MTLKMRGGIPTPTPPHKESPHNFHPACASPSPLKGEGKKELRAGEGRGEKSGVRGKGEKKKGSAQGKGRKKGVRGKGKEKKGGCMQGKGKGKKAADGCKH